MRRRTFLISLRRITGSFDLFSAAKFEIGDRDQLGALRNEFSTSLSDPSDLERFEKGWADFLTDIRIRLGTLLKVDNVSLLLGAGASKPAGGPLLGSVPLALEKILLEEGIANDQVREWLDVFYSAVAVVADEPSLVPVGQEGILERSANLGAAQPLPANCELVLSNLYAWSQAFPSPTTQLALAGSSRPVLRQSDVCDCMRRLTDALVAQCILPSATASGDSLVHHRDLLKRLLTRPLTLKRVNVFTLNYDTLVEQASDAEGAVLLDGFVGTMQRVFRPESYDHDLYFPAETTEGRVHRLDRVIHLYKLHGSVSWRSSSPSWSNPYGLQATEGTLDGADSAVIYPTPAKYGATLGMPYAELFRRFANTIVRPQSTLIVVGYGFRDEHVNSIIRQALGVPSFSLVIVDPEPTSDFVQTLRNQADLRVWFVGGRTLGTIEGFVSRVLPDLRDEEILRKVIGTYNALGNLPATPVSSGP
jgi:SIR2-like domain